MHRPSKLNLMCHLNSTFCFGIHHIILTQNLLNSRGFGHQNYAYFAITTRKQLNASWGIVLLANKGGSLLTRMGPTLLKCIGIGWIALDPTSCLVSIRFLWRVLFFPFIWQIWLTKNVKVFRKDKFIPGQSNRKRGILRPF